MNYLIRETKSEPRMYISGKSFLRSIRFEFGLLIKVNFIQKFHVDDIQSFPD